MTYHAYPYWVEAEGHDPVLVRDRAEHVALLEKRGLDIEPEPQAPELRYDPPAMFHEFPKVVGEFIVEDAAEEKIARAGDPNGIEAVWQRIFDHRSAMQRAEAEAADAPRQFPKWVGGVIVHSLWEEAEVRRKAAQKATEALSFRPSPEVRQILDAAVAEGREVDEAINKAVAAWHKWQSSAFKARKGGKQAA